MNTLRDEAVVLRTYRSGESDRVVVLWGRELGKIRTIAKGVRKTTSKIGGGLEPLSHVNIFLADSRGDLKIVKQVEHCNRFATLKGSFERITAGMALVEVVDAIPSEDLADEGIFTMLVRALETLDDPEIVPVLVPAAFFLKLLALDGSEPLLDCCVNCSSEGPLVAFDAAQGGTTCRDCRSGRQISSEALVVMQRMMGGDLAGVLREANPAGAGEAMAVSQEAIERHFNRRLKVARSTPAS